MRVDVCLHSPVEHVFVEVVIRVLDPFDPGPPIRLVIDGLEQRDALLTIERRDFMQYATIWPSVASARASEIGRGVSSSSQKA